MLIFELIVIFLNKTVYIIGMSADLVPDSLLKELCLEFRGVSGQPSIAQAK